MMMKKYNLYIILFICTLSSCSDFLEESSQDLMIPRSVKDYKELFFGEVMKTNEKDIPHPYLEYMTDDVKDQCSMEPDHKSFLMISENMFGHIIRGRETRKWEFQMNLRRMLHGQSIIIRY